MSLGLNDLREIIQNDRWKDVLIDLVIGNKIDPWDVNIEIVAGEFLKYIRHMNEYDLSVPANIVLATSIILKYKANTLKYIFGNENENDGDEYSDDALDMPPLDGIPQLTMINRIPPKRKVTLTELINEIEKVMKYDEKPDRYRKEKIKYYPLILNISEGSTEEKINEIYVKIEKNIDKEGWTTFSRIVDNKEPYTLVSTLLGMLHLRQREKIIIKQEDIFDEIFVRISNSKK